MDVYTVNGLGSGSSQLDKGLIVINALKYVHNDGLN